MVPYFAPEGTDPRLTLKQSDFFQPCHHRRLDSRPSLAWIKMSRDCYNGLDDILAMNECAFNLI